MRLNQEEFQDVSNTSYSNSGWAKFWKSGFDWSSRSFDWSLLTQLWNSSSAWICPFPHLSAHSIRVRNVVIELCFSGANLFCWLWVWRLLQKNQQIIVVIWAEFFFENSTYIKLIVRPNSSSPSSLIWWWGKYYIWIGPDFGTKYCFIKESQLHLVFGNKTFHFQ